MIYLATSPGEPAVADLLNRRRIGLMSQPGSNPPRAGWIWAADNGCFAARWDPDGWARWLARDWPRAGCLFAVVPDVVADHAATLERFDQYGPEVRASRYPVAFVAQNGCTPATVPWDKIDAVFIGGDTAWKMGDDARAVAAAARARSRWVHVGRVNSHSRFRAWAPYADSCDGTLLAYGPAVNVHRLRRIVDHHDANPQLAL